MTDFSVLLNEEADLDIYKVSNQFVHRETCFDKGTGLMSSGALSYSEWNEEISVHYRHYQNLESILQTCFNLIVLHHLLVTVQCQ